MGLFRYMFVVVLIWIPWVLTVLKLEYYLVQSVWFQVGNAVKGQNFWTIYQNLCVSLIPQGVYAGTQRRCIGIHARKSDVSARMHNDCEMVLTSVSQGWIKCFFPQKQALKLKTPLHMPITSMCWLPQFSLSFPGSCASRSCLLSTSWRHCQLEIVQTVGAWSSCNTLGWKITTVFLRFDYRICVNDTSKYCL